MADIKALVLPLEPKLRRRGQDELCLPPLQEAQSNGQHLAHM